MLTLNLNDITDIDELIMVYVSAYVWNNDVYQCISWRI